MAEVDLSNPGHKVSGKLPLTKLEAQMRTHGLIGPTLALGVLLFVSPSTAQTCVFPENGQSPEQQEQDDFACYKWAK
jgi:hypothetical protein